MSAKTVRQAIADFIAPPNVVGVNTVHRSQPKIIPATDFAGADGSGRGGVVVIHIGHQEDQILGHGSGKFERALTYHVDLILRYRDASGDAEACQDGFDDMAEALKARLRSDVALGTSGGDNPITLSGVGSGVPGRGATDFTLDQDLPRQETAGGGILIWAVLRMGNVVEVVMV